MTPSPQPSPPFLLSAWYGIGHALQEFAHQEPDGLDKLRDLYRHWPFFRSLLDNAELSLAKTDLGNAGQYAALVRDDGVREGFNTMKYAEHEVERVARVAFEAARKRHKKLCFVEKANVLETSGLRREVVLKVAKDYADIELSHMYVDNAAMQLVRAPKQFDVIVTGNIFGDILSDEAAMLTGSMGMLPSASLDTANKGMYEPIHGSAPDIAGKGIANPLATILSAAMMLRYTLGEPKLAERIEQAVSKVLDQGLRTGDIWTEGTRKVGTKEMGDAVVGAL